MSTLLSLAYINITIENLDVDFIGEMIDAHGFTGGFNLQIAFSTAVAAADGIKQKYGEWF